MGQTCCNPKHIDKNALDIPLSGNQDYEESKYDNPKNNLESNTLVVCSYKSNNELNYNIKYTPKKK
jgi:hypothetical protein